MGSLAGRTSGYNVVRGSVAEACESNPVADCSAFCCAKCARITPCNPAQVRCLRGSPLKPEYRWTFRNRQVVVVALGRHSVLSLIRTLQPETPTKPASASQCRGCGR
jgi:hypothetical protein